MSSMNGGKELINVLSMSIKNLATRYRWAKRP
jgi:hypothetical protein